MCLAIPGKVVEWINREQPFLTASVEFGGVRKTINMQCVPEAVAGDYVLVHAGVAISGVDPAEATRILEVFEELEADASFESPTNDSPP